DVAGMQVVMDDASAVHPGKQFAHLHGDALAKARLPRLRPAWQLQFEERVQLASVGQGVSEKETVAGAPARDAGGEWRVGGAVARCHGEGALILRQRLARPQPFAQMSTGVGGAVVLEEEIQAGQMHLIDGAMTGMLDDARLAVLQPFVEAKA